MTKKSQARMMRDAEVKAKTENREQAVSKPIWNDVIGIYEQCVALLRSNVAIAAITDNQKLLAHVQNVPQLVSNIQILTKDLQMLKAELVEISAQHNGKTGRPANLDEYTNAIVISEQYAAWTERYEGIVMPTVKYINEQIYEAEVLLGQTDEAASSELVATMAPVLEQIKNGTAADPVPNMTPEQDPGVITDVVVKTD